MPAPRVTCLTPTHKTAEKLPYLLDLHSCLVNQTMPDWEWILMADQREDYDILLQADLDPRVSLVYDSLEDVDRGQRHPIPVLYNRYYPEARGEFIFPAFDDDLINWHTFGVFTSYFDANPGSRACYISLQHQYVDAPGIQDENRAHWLPADRIRTSGMLDCQIDGGQACIRKSLLDDVPAPWWPETAVWSEVRHCDGLYLQHLSQATDFVPTGEPGVPYLIHRFTPVSTFTKNTGVVNG